MPTNYNTAYSESEITLLDIYDSNVTSVLQSLPRPASSRHRIYCLPARAFITQGALVYSY